MDVKKILEQVSMGTLSPEEAGEMLKTCHTKSWDMQNSICTESCAPVFLKPCTVRENPISIWRIYLTRCTVKMVR